MYSICKSDVNYKRKFILAFLDITKCYSFIDQSKYRKCDTGRQRFPLCFTDGHDNLYRHCDRRRRNEHLHSDSYRHNSSASANMHSICKSYVDYKRKLIFPFLDIAKRNSFIDQSKYRKRDTDR